MEDIRGFSSRVQRQQLSLAAEVQRLVSVSLQEEIQSTHSNGAALLQEGMRQVQVALERKYSVQLRTLEAENQRLRAELQQRQEPAFARAKSALPPAATTGVGAVERTTAAKAKVMYPPSDAAWDQTAKLGRHTPPPPSPQASTASNATFLNSATAAATFPHSNFSSPAPLRGLGPEPPCAGQGPGTSPWAPALSRAPGQWPAPVTHTPIGPARAAPSPVTGRTRAQVWTAEEDRAWAIGTAALAGKHPPVLAQAHEQQPLSSVAQSPDSKRVAATLLHAAELDASPRTTSCDQHTPPPAARPAPVPGRAACPRAPGAYTVGGVNPALLPQHAPLSGTSPAPPRHHVAVSPLRNAWAGQLHPPVATWNAWMDGGAYSAAKYQSPGSPRMFAPGADDGPASASTVESSCSPVSTPVSTGAGGEGGLDAFLASYAAGGGSGASAAGRMPSYLSPELGFNDRLERVASPGLCDAAVASGTAWRDTPDMAHIAAVAAAAVAATTDLGLGSQADVALAAYQELYEEYCRQLARYSHGSAHGDVGLDAEGDLADSPRTLRRHSAWIEHVIRNWAGTGIGSGAEGAGSSLAPGSVPAAAAGIAASTGAGPGGGFIASTGAGAGAGSAASTPPPQQRVQAHSPGGVQQGTSTAGSPAGAVLGSGWAAPGFMGNGSAALPPEQQASREERIETLMRQYDRLAARDLGLLEEQLYAHADQSIGDETGAAAGAGTAPGGDGSGVKLNASTGIGDSPGGLSNVRMPCQAPSWEQEGVMAGSGSSSGDAGWVSGGAEEALLKQRAAAVVGGGRTAVTGAQRRRAALHDTLDGLQRNEERQRDLLARCRQEREQLHAACDSLAEGLRPATPREPRGSSSSML